jgi:hypothetical protein
MALNVLYDLASNVGGDLRNPGYGIICAVVHPDKLLAADDVVTIAAVQQFDIQESDVNNVALLVKGPNAGVDFRQTAIQEAV